MKGGVSSEAEPPTKKQKKVKAQNESEVAEAGKGSSEKEGSKDLELENKATLRTIVSTLDNISRKFEQFDSQLEAYELDWNRPLIDQKTIDDSVKALLEERLKVLGVGKIPEKNDNPSPPSTDKSLSLPSPRVQKQQNSVNSPALAATPGKVFGPKKNLAKELDKESGVKRTLAEEFGSVAKATDLDSQHVDFVLVSPSKATKDDKDAKVPAYGRGCRGKRIVKGEETDEKNEAEPADAVFKRKEKAEAKKKAAEAKKKDAEAKKKEAEAKKKEAEDKSLSLPSPRVQKQQNSVNSPALAATPGKVFGPKKNLAKELDKESGVKRTLAEEFGSVAKATDLDSQHVDFVLVSPSKATKDDKDAKVPVYGRGCRGKRTVKGEEADEKKKAAQADAAFKRKEKAEAKKKAAEAKKKDAEANKKEAEPKKKEAEGKKKQEAEGKKKEAELKKKQEAGLKKRKHAESKNKEATPSGEDSVFADVTDEVVGGRERIRAGV
ncbi:hypothetical protein F2Q68_00017228 [Brassica cretica]|uniref:Uncharacterized protein n=1 Tax=Brassica cretica TaxID=69181 RepID=A0A8S9HM70_BRACR|nr:hypothetical protein F2Q68_00017228 [Brassica cretica]